MGSLKKLATITAAICLGCLADASSAESVSYYYTNEQGTVLTVTTATGAVVSSQDHHPYGQDALAAPLDGPGYGGHVEDLDTQFVYMQARYYDAALGRFLSPDPVTPTNGGVFRLNRYVYGNDNPVANIDPDGRNTISDGRNTDPCSSPANVCTVDYQSGDGSINTPPARSQVSSDVGHDSNGIPEDAYLFWTGDDQYHFYGPPSESDFMAIDVTARRDAQAGGGLASIKSIREAVSHGGRFDIQRTSGKFEMAYQGGANFNVGFYMQRAGYSERETIFMGTLFSLTHSTNALKFEDQAWWSRGWEAAQANQYPISMRNHPDHEAVNDASK